MKPFDESMLTAYLDDELSPEERRLVEEQLAANESLRSLLDDISTVRTMVQSLGPIEPAVDMSEQVFARIAKGTSSIEEDSAKEISVLPNNGVVSPPGPLASGSNVSTDFGNRSGKFFGLFALAAIAASVLFMLSTQFWDHETIVWRSPSSQEKFSTAEAMGAAPNVEELKRGESEAHGELGTEAVMVDPATVGSETTIELEFAKAGSIAEKKVESLVEGDLQNAPAMPPSNRRLSAPGSIPGSARGGLGGGGGFAGGGGMGGPVGSSRAAIPLAQDPAPVSDQAEDSPASPRDLYAFSMNDQAEERKKQSEAGSLTWELRNELQQIQDLYLVPDFQNDRLGITPNQTDFQDNKQDKVLQEESLAMTTKEAVGEDVFQRLSDAQPLVVRISPVTEGESLDLEESDLGRVVPENGRRLQEVIGKGNLAAKSLQSDSLAESAKKENGAKQSEERELGRLSEPHVQRVTGEAKSSNRWLVRQYRWREIEKQLALKNRKVELGVTNPMRPPMVENPPSLDDDGWLLIEIQVP